MTRKFCLIFLVIINALIAKSQTNCSTAVLLPVNSQIIDSISNEYWVKYVPTESTCRLEVSALNGSTLNGIKSVEFFSGPCNNLNLLATDSSLALTDSSLNLSIGNLAVGQEYYIKIFADTNPCVNCLPVKKPFKLLADPFWGIWWVDPITGLPTYCLSYFSQNIPPSQQSCNVSLQTSCCIELNPEINNYTVGNPVTWLVNGSPTYTTPMTALGTAPFLFCNYPVGTYTVTWQFSSVSGSNSTAVINVTQQNNYTITATPNPVCVNSPVTFTVNANPSLTNIEYYFGDGATDFNGNNVTVHSYASPGTYTVICNIIDYPNSPNPCTTSVTTTVTVLQPVINASVNPNPVCPGSLIALTASSTINPVTFSWQPGGLIGSPVNTLLNSNTTFTVTGTVIIGGATCSNSVTVSATVLPIPVISIGSNPVCSGGQVSLSGNGANTYSWSVNNPGVTINGTAPFSNISAGPINAVTTFTVTGIGPNGCAGTQTITITPVAPPVLLLSNSNPTICAAGNPNSSTLSVSPVFPGVTYTWSTGVVATSINVSPSVTTGYTLTASNGVCPPVSASTTVTVNNQPLNLVFAPAPYCQNIGPQGTIQVNGGSGTYSISPVGLSGATSNNGTFLVNPSTSTNYTITAPGNGGCLSSLIVPITVLPVPNFTVSAINSSAYVGSNTLTLSVSPSGPYIYAWTPTSAFSPTVGSPVSVTPLVNGTNVYQVTATDPVTGCAKSQPLYVNGIPGPTISSIPPKTICSGSQTTFLVNAFAAGGIQNISVSPTPVSINQASGIVTVAPTSSTIYTITVNGSNGCSSIANATITVLPTPNVFISPNNPSTCAGLPFVFTAVGANTYTWTPGFGPGPFTGATHTYTMPNSGTYTVGVTGTGPNGCKSSATATVNVNPNIPISISASLPSNNCGVSNPLQGICAGQSIVLTANHPTATSFTWQPGNLTGTTVTVTPNVTTTYSVSSFSAPPNTCVSQGTFTIPITQNCNCTGMLASYPTSPNTTMNLVPVGAIVSYAINSNIVVPPGATWNISGVTLNISQNISITVSAGATLNISNSHLRACRDMWDGIVVDQGGLLDISNNSIIQDAKVAVSNNSLAPNFTSIRIFNSVFNANRVGVRISRYSIPGNFNPIPFFIDNVVFTSRCGLAQGVPANSSAALLAFSGNTNAPLISDNFPVGNFPTATLKPPFSGQYPLQGINLVNLGLLSTTIPSSGTSLFQNFANIGGTGYLLFDNHTYGIDALNSTFKVINANYQNPRLAPSAKGALTIGGYGINAINNLPDYYNGIQVENNLFVNMIRGVHNINYFQMFFDNNRFISRQNVNTLLSPPSIIPNGGEMASFIKTFRWRSMDFVNSSVWNHRTGIYFIVDALAGGYNGGNGQYVGPVKIAYNTFEPKPFGDPYANPFLGDAILVDNIINYYPPAGTQLPQAPVGVLNSDIGIRSNTIKSCFRGITARNHLFQSVRTEDNSISMVQEPSLIANTAQYGIGHFNCGAGTFFQPNNPGMVYPSIYNNTISGFISPALYGSPNLDKKMGITCQWTYHHYVTCNTVSACGADFLFAQNNPSTTWQSNTMNAGAYGLYLQNQGIIDQQGNANNPIGNQWLGFSLPNPHTMTDASNADFSPLYVMNAINQIPIANGQSNGLPYDPLIPSSTNLFYATGVSFDCSSAPLIVMPSDSLGGTEIIISDSVLSYGYDSIGVYQERNQVFRILSEDSSFINSQIISTFNLNNQGSCWKKYCEMEREIYSYNYQYVQNLINNFVGVNPMQIVYKDFYAIYLKSKFTALSVSDSLLSFRIANSCPARFGSVVHQLRTFLNAYYQNNFYFTDSCEIIPATFVNRKKKRISSISNPSPIIFPNPNNGEFSIKTLPKTHDQFRYLIFDQYGRKVYESIHEEGIEITRFSLDLSNGVYFIKQLGIDGGLINQLKLVISK